MVKLVIGAIVDMVTMTLDLPHHHVMQLRKILDRIPCIQYRTSAKKWLKVLGELRYIDRALPGTHTVFIRPQNALDKDTKT